MPLLTRIEKRLSKKDKEDKLGITDLKRKMKEMQEENGEVDDANSDSDSSGSDDSDDDSDDSDDDEGVPLSDEEDSSSDDDEEENDEEVEEGAESEAEDDDESIPLESVLENPIYSLAEDEEPETAPEAEEAKDGGEETDSKQGPMGCMLCPNKVLKNEKMVEVHLSSKPHKRSAARFAKKIEDPTFDRSQVMDPRDIAIQIEEEIRAGNKSSSVPTANPDASKSRSKASKASATTECPRYHKPESTEVKPKRERAWKAAKKEAKRRRVEAKETGQPPRKQVEREKKSQKEAAPATATPKFSKKQREASTGAEVFTGVKTDSKRVKKKEGKKSRISDAPRPRN
ncbi:hypothetical protein QFC24_000224 [Naganishia onofrii]|uniref:Uncharacterized protein n=1 Tax=Naganishia onofrii TaxID=1851511 RepID=A0ACC2XWQ1_9TREE|nr:hypothetical protein QFC24_000224 [Naganishia onofrii]